MIPMQEIEVNNGDYKIVIMNVQGGYVYRLQERLTSGTLAGLHSDFLTCNNVSADVNATFESAVKVLATYFSTLRLSISSINNYAGCELIDLKDQNTILTNNRITISATKNLR
ncbi:hypothetical protein HYN73_22875 [Vibrio parahaemolyticus]|uniref:hypothetical protein n=1 Tax=Vibrio parahaemolyticus TaxID=670 RepID=UPI0004D3E729|nr:hypothetical protein [Vibrio parahaemolyticus]EGR1699832.1 hypothetical protein [Vibrio parahaemolyticus]MBM5193888.1 hypothetical protein [Vibrio parahaemolyticus]MBM5203127.1 hypothetical protein [Vibrio parahaemolyticus]MBM5207592.1 hypothetical protein [Vibrio parahaemolyticus]MBM5212044.1 hypothetical protein [Vibrio parahaemolyticus]